MGAIGFYLFYAINWIVTLLPLRVLYLFSDIMFPVVYYIAGYRRKVVAMNLKNAFPEKSERERIDIEKKFYHHFCDLMVEILKLTHMSNKQLVKRNTLTNPEYLKRLYDEGRDVIAIMAHYGNWEWNSILPAFTKLRLVGIYKPLQNKYFDRFMLTLRQRNKGDTVAMAGVIREVIKNRNINRRAIYAFATDQTPARGEIRFWTRFLNQDTPVFLGPEKIATKYNMAVLFLNMQKVRRGQYQMTIEPLFEHTAALSGHQITEAHVKRLEEIIRDRPELWLWSHRRWKYKRAEADG